MPKFTKTTIRILLIGATFLAGGVFYQKYAAGLLVESRAAVNRVESAQVRAETAAERYQLYARLLTTLNDHELDRQEPFSLVSEFSPQEIAKIGPLLNMLYLRDGHFFLEDFQLSWKYTNNQLDLRPRVALELDGRKVLSFSDETTQPASIAAVEH